MSNLLGGSNVWDADKVASKPLMTVQEWRQWHEAGMDVGSHTCNHADLTAIDPKDAAHEIAHSKRALETAIGCEVKHFCYPYGRYTEAHSHMAKEAGYVTATTTMRGRAHPGDDLFTLKRVMVARATHLLQFVFKVGSQYEDVRT